MVLEVRNTLTSGSLLSIPYTSSAWVYVDTSESLDQSATLGERITNDFEVALTGVATWEQAINEFRVTAAAQSSISTISSAVASMTGSDGWYHVAVVHGSTTSRKAFINYSNSATDTTSIVPVFGVSAYTQSIGTWPTAGRKMPIADIAVWDVALSDSQIQALSEGVPPIYIQPGDMIHYIPAFAGAQDFIQGHGYWTEAGSLAERDFGQPPILKRFGA